MKLLHHLDVGKILRTFCEVVHVVVVYQKRSLLQTYNAFSVNSDGLRDV